jgi:hypothetical protein
MQHKNFNLHPKAIAITGVKKFKPNNNIKYNQESSKYLITNIEKDDVKRHKTTKIPKLEKVLY